MLGWAGLGSLASRKLALGCSHEALPQLATSLSPRRMRPTRAPLRAPPPPDPALDGHFDRVNLLLWPRLKVRCAARAVQGGAKWRSLCPPGNLEAVFVFAHPCAAPRPTCMQALFDLQLASIKALHPTQSSVDAQPRLHPLTGAPPLGGRRVLLPGHCMHAP